MLDLHACAAQILKHAALSANLAGEEPIDKVMHNCYPGKDTLWQVCACSMCGRPFTMCCSA